MILGAVNQIARMLFLEMIKINFVILYVYTLLHTKLYSISDFEVE